MKITITQGAFLPVPPLLGGAVEKAWFALGQAFAARGHEVTHISRAFGELPRSEVIGDVRHVRVSGFAATGNSAARNGCDLLYGLRVLRRLPPADVLVTNSFWLPALSRRRSRGIVYAHVARFPKGQMRLYRRAILQTVSAPIRDAIVAECPAAAGRVRVIPYPIAPQYLWGGDGALPEGGDVLLYAGRVHPEKGVRVLIDAFARLPEALRARWKLKIVGPWKVEQGGGGEKYFEELRRAAACAGVPERVEFAGAIFDERELVAQYRAASVFVYPSLAERGETFGLAALEAMASGCAPVVSSLACFRDFIAPDVNGAVFNHRAGDAAGELARVLGALLADGARVEALRRAALETAREYSLEKIADEFLEDFAALVADGNGNKCNPIGYNPILRT